MKSAKDMAASAKAGMEKTKATLQEKGEKMTAHDPLSKELATEKKEERIHEAERQKLEAQRHNAAVSHGGVLGQGHGHTTGAGVGHPTGAEYAAEEMGRGEGGVGHTTTTHRTTTHHTTGGGGGTY